MSSNTNLSYTGTIIFIGQTEVISDKFQKRQIVLSDKTSEYPQEICFEFTQAKCNDLDMHTVGGLVTVHYNLRGKLWKDNKWFNVLNGWKVERVSFNNDVKESTATVAEVKADVVSNDDQDLPF